MLKFELIQINKDYLLISNENVTKDNMSTYLLDKANNEIVVAFDWLNFEKYSKIYASTFPFGNIQLLDKNNIIELILDRSYSLKEVRNIFKNLKNDLDTHLLNMCSKDRWKAKIECTITNSDRNISEATVGDYVLNRHGNGGIIHNIDDDPRVSIDNYIEIAETSNNGYETLDICGYQIIDKIEPIIEHNYINILSLE